MSFPLGCKKPETMLVSGAMSIYIYMFVYVLCIMYIHIHSFDSIHGSLFDANVCLSFLLSSPTCNHQPAFSPLKTRMFPSGKRKKHLIQRHHRFFKVCVTFNPEPGFNVKSVLHTLHSPKTDWG